MELLIGASIPLSSGSSSSTTLLKAFGTIFDYENGYAYVKTHVWKSRSAKDDGKQILYIWDGTKNVEQVSYAIPEDEIPQPGDTEEQVNQKFADIGKNHLPRLKSAIAAINGIDPNDITISWP